MSRPLRIDYPGAIHHVTSRTMEGQALFRDDFDRAYFLGDLARVVDRYGLIVHAYCQMGNHYHGLFETPNANLSLAVRQLNGVYAQGFNARWARYGHVFQGRFKSRLVERGAHLLAVCRYCDRNPVDAGFCGHPSEWRWGSYRAYAGLEPAPRFLRPEWVLSQFGRRRGAARRAYCAYVAEGLHAPPPRAVGEIYLGTAEFAQRNAPDDAVPETPRTHWQPVRPSLESVLAEEDDGAGIVVAYRQYGYRLRELADFLGVHSSTVSRRLRGWESGRGA